MFHNRLSVIHGPEECFAILLNNFPIRKKMMSVHVNTFLRVGSCLFRIMFILKYFGVKNHSEKFFLRLLRNEMKKLLS